MRITTFSKSALMTTVFILLVVLTASRLVTVSADAHPFVGGDGAEGSPFQIETCEQLQAMKNYLSSSFVLNNNIDCSMTSGWNNGAGFEPVGKDHTDKFTGSFDGAGFNISGLFINRSAQGFIGLFGVVSPGTIISNVNIIDFEIVGRNSVGGLVGYSNEGFISNSSAIGNVTTTDPSAIYVGGLVGYNAKGIILNSHTSGNVNGIDFVGGLVGYNEEGNISDSYSISNVSGDFMVGGLVGNNWRGTISDSSASGNVTAGNFDGNSYVGGLAGDNAEGIILNSYATGNVNSTGSYVGGLVGTSDGNISNSYATGNVYADYAPWSNAGGLVGYSGGSINNSYATGNVTGTGGDVGGLVGWNNGDILNSYATGNVTTTDSYAGGLIGWNDEVFVSNSYWYNSTENSELSCSGNTEENSCFAIEDLTYFYDYDNPPMSMLGDGWDFEEVWSDFCSEHGYSTLQWQGIDDATMCSGYEEPTTYTLTYTAGTGGTISGTTSQTVNSGSSGSPVTAVSNSGYRFVRWSDNSTSNPRTDANVTRNISVSVTFERVSTPRGGSGFIAPIVVSTNDSQILQLQRQVALLTEQLNTLLRQQGPSAVSTPGTSAVYFSRNLRRGDIGEDVKRLQVFLNTRGFKLADSGPGSLGNEIDVFGRLTESALIKFQEAYFDEILKPQNLSRGTGIFHSYSRTKANSLLAE